MLHIRLFVFLAAFLQGTTSFTPSLLPATTPHKAQVSARSKRALSLSRHSFSFPRRATEKNGGESPVDDGPMEETSSSPPPPQSKSADKPAVDPMPPPQMLRTPPSPPPKRLDPLLASLTRVDPQAVSSNAPKTQIPLLGEVTLDKQLFIVLPIVAFAILGFLSFALVAFNSRDVFVDAINEWNDSVLNPPPPVPIDPNECRGLCSSQEQDLEGLRNFMNNLGGKKY